MILTEEEARTKWCPMARTMVVTPEYQGTGNRINHMNDEIIVTNPTECRCIASECAIWQWSKNDREYRRVYKGKTEEDGNPIVRAGSLIVINGEKWRYEYTDVDDKGEFDLVHRARPENQPSVGYCGLTSK